MPELSLVDSQDALGRLGLALSDPVRRSVLVHLSESPAYPKDLAELCDTSRSNMSNHLNCLRGCGLIVAEREGRNIRYELVSQEFAAALRSLAKITLAATCDHP